MFEPLLANDFEVVALHHAEAILEHDMPGAIDELVQVLLGIELPIQEIIKGGGGEGKLTQRIRKALSDLGWKKHNFEVRKTIDGREAESKSHEVDHVKVFEGSTFALEIEWNNKDPFFDRDLENFKRLHADGAISVGAIITRGESLQSRLRELVQQFAQQSGFSAIENLAPYYSPTARQKKLISKAVEKEHDFAAGWSKAFTSDKYGEATTHWRKLQDRVQRGVGNPCPLLLIGIPAAVVKPMGNTR